jgi:hypothetical protein
VQKPGVHTAEVAGVGESRQCSCAGSSGGDARVREACWGVGCGEGQEVQGGKEAAVEAAGEGLRTA